MKGSVSQSRVFVRRIEALADPTRLRVLRVLERHELSVVELCEVLQLPQSTVSRHLKLLSDQAWIESRRKGTSNLYRMDSRHLEPTSSQLWKAAREETLHWPSTDQDGLRLERHLELRRSRSRSFFAGAADQWDALRTQLYGGHFSMAAMLALLPSGLTVADLGCGTGELTAQLAPYARRVIGIDQSEAMLAAARRRTSGLRNVELREGDLEALPIETGCCDAALLVLALTYAADPASVLREVSRVLRRGGRVVVVDLSLHERDDFRQEMRQLWLGFSPQEIREELVRAGFEEARVRSLPPESSVRGPARFSATAQRGPAEPTKQDD